MFKRHLSRITDLSLFIFLSLFSFYAVVRSGERGFFAFDQSIVFDGAYRIICGQIPYKDFVIPFGPGVFFIQAFFFKIWGLNYFSYIFSAALFNVLAALLSVIIFRLIFPSDKFLSYLAGILSAVWFYPPLGTLYMEQEAFFFALCSLALILYAVSGKNLIHPYLIMPAAGCFAFISILSKQNAGFFIFPLYFLLIFCAYPPDYKKNLRLSLYFLCGFFASGLLFFLWLSINSDLKTFLRYAFGNPLSVGAYRLFGENSRVLRTFIWGAGPLPNRMLLFIIFLIAAIAAVRSILRLKQDAQPYSRRYFLSAVFCLYLIFFQYLFISTTSNNAENGFPFIGLIFAFGVELLNGFVAFSRRVFSLLRNISVSFLALWVLICGINVSLGRKVNNAFSGASFPSYSSIKGLEALKWGRPTRIHGVDIKEGYLSGLIAYLKEKNKNFFIFPDYTVLYALLNKPSPQPLVWFHRGLTYPYYYDVKLDKWIVKDLKKNKVEIVVLEEVSYFGTDKRLDSFPILKSFILREFIKTRRIGIFDIYEKKV